MKYFKWFQMSIRVRLIVVYVSILLLGFTVLTFVAGNQLSRTARADFEDQFINSASLIAQGVSPFVSPSDRTDNISDELANAIADFEAESGAKIEFLYVDTAYLETIRDIQNQFGTTTPNGGLFEQVDENGVARLYTFMPVGDFSLEEEVPQLDNLQDFVDILQGVIDSISLGFPMLVISVPTDWLNASILNRWLMFTAVLVLVGTLAIIASLWLARTIIRPLHNLRDSAVLLAHGDFSHRIKEIGNDEIGEVSQAFNHMVQQVENMMQEQRAFASNASHELRTPLTTIRLRSEALRYDDLDSDLAQAYIAQIDDEARRMTNLIEDLTLLSRFDAQRAELGDSEIDLIRLAESLVHKHQAQAIHKAITLHLETTATVASIRASMTHMMIVFRNILDNAIKYTPEGGTVVWTIREDQDAVISTIVDNGQGIDPKNLSRLFERFYRVDASRSRMVQGTGLGLPLVRSIVEAYGGQVQIESEGANQGTKVTITLFKN